MLRPRTSIRLAALIVLALVALCLPAAADARPARCANASVYPGAASVSTVSRATVCLLNVERRKRHMHKLRLNRRLSAAAREHSTDMVVNRYFAHDSNGGLDVVDRLRDTGYIRPAVSWTVGENLAWGAGTRSTPRQIVRSWMHSPPHRHNILTRRFREIGIGVVFRSPVDAEAGAATYTTTFGVRR